MTSSYVSAYSYDITIGAVGLYESDAHLPIDDMGGILESMTNDHAIYMLIFNEAIHYILRSSLVRCFENRHLGSGDCKRNDTGR